MSLLDLATSAHLLHVGGEANLYRLYTSDGDFILKWYKQELSFDKAVLNCVKNSKDTGHFKIREYGNRDGAAYVLYEYVHGVASDNVEPMPVAVALYALRQVVGTLTKLKTSGTSHGDLCPSNVMLSTVEIDACYDLRTTLIDFGIVGPGALAYAAPERIAGKAPSEKSDLFSLGLLLYRWIAGEELIVADDFDGFATKMNEVESVSVTEKLYVKSLGTGGSAVEPQVLSALEPLWKRLLRVNPENRVDDLDELDELLEIALDKVCEGRAAQVAEIQRYLWNYFIEKMGENVPLSEDVAGTEVLPYKIGCSAAKKRKAKIFVFGAGVLILLIVAYCLLFGMKNSDIDATGDMLLQRSRSLQIDKSAVSEPTAEPVTSDSAGVRKMLDDLPTPVSE